MNIENVENRGYFKMQGAVDSFGFDFVDKIVLDIGSSTGGFTAFALERGAKKIIAVEKGTRQMKAPLRFDRRVELHEKTDIFEFRFDAEVRPDVVVADVSFVSLAKVLAYAKKNLVNGQTDFLVMMKPQFEAMPRDLVKGVVKNNAIRRRIIRDFEFWLKRHGFLVVKKRDNELRGKLGNQERFYWLKMVE